MHRRIFQLFQSNFFRRFIGEILVFIFFWTQRFRGRCRAPHRHQLRRARNKKTCCASAHRRIAWRMQPREGDSKSFFSRYLEIIPRLKNRLRVLGCVLCWVLYGISTIPSSSETRPHTIAVSFRRSETDQLPRQVVLDVCQPGFEETRSSRPRIGKPSPMGPFGPCDVRKPVVSFR